MIFTILLYSLTVILLILSLLMDRKKTIKGLKKAWKAFENILPQFLGIIVLVGILVAFLDPQTISGLIGTNSGWSGTIFAGLLGSVTLIPGFIAFPTAALLLKNGAGYMQIGAFVSTLMMVGVVTFPVEKKYFGIKASLVRNLFSFVFSFIVAFALGWVCSL
ncbi:MAG: permease [Spirochaetales bacterium]|nr:permease [Spirochaetales bacterium]